MAQKHLHELLQDDQEPFQLKNYIADRRCRIGRPCSKTDLQIRKRKPISTNPGFPSNFCKSSCFFPGHGSPDLRKSPLFEFRSPRKSPNRVFLHVPASTAAILLEAAARIQRESSKNSKSKVRNRGNGYGFGLIGSVLKRLTQRTTTRKPEILCNTEKAKPRLQNVEEKHTPRFACSSSGNRSRKAVWTERRLDSDSESSCSSLHGERDEFEYGNAEAAGDFEGCDCDSPFRFVLRTSPASSGLRTPHFTSPATSPTRRCSEDEDSDEAESLMKSQQEEEEEEEEEEEDKEQCSPVSVLDPLFEEDRDDGNDNGNEDNNVEGDLDLGCSFEIVRRAKHRLLQKLRRFEQLAGLDPVDLESILSEPEEEGEESEESNERGDKKIEEEVKKEKRCTECIWRKLYSWRRGGRDEAFKMIMEEGFRDEEEREWKRNQEEIEEESVIDIEFEIFGYLVEELSQELLSSH